MKKKFFFFFNISFFFIFPAKKTFHQDHLLMLFFSDSKPVLDGNIISDEFWVNVPVLKDKMIQQNLFLGLESTENTEIRITYNNSTLFLGVVCYDSSPNTLVVSDSRRDSDLSDDDSFLFIIDTYNDQQNGFLFGTNSDGMEYDAQIDNEGVGNRTAQRQQGGVVGGTNVKLGYFLECKNRKKMIMGGVLNLQFH